MECGCYGHEGLENGLDIAAMARPSVDTKNALGAGYEDQGLIFPSVKGPP